MRVFDFTRPDGWKWPAAAFTVVTALMLAANLVVRREQAGFDKGDVLVVLAEYDARGWPLNWWTRGAGGTGGVRPWRAAVNMTVSALLAGGAALAVRRLRPDRRAADAGATDDR